MAGAPSVDLTVIIPFVDPRGLGLTALRRWAREQTADRRRFRVLVMLAPAATHSEAEVRTVLDSSDSAARAEGGVGALLDAGARLADTRLVLLTEGHCLPDSQCVEELLTYFDANPHLDGALLRSSHGNRSALASFEARMYDANVAGWIATAPLHCVNVRGFAIRREVYLAAGGIDASLRFFAENALSARLRDAGVRVGYAGKAIVQHQNTNEIGRLRASIAEYVVGELEYVKRSSVAAFEADFGSLVEASVLAASDWGLAAEEVRALLLLARRKLGWRSRADLVCEMARRAAGILFGRTGLRLAAETRLFLLRARYSAEAICPRKRYRTYAALWGSITRCERLRQSPFTARAEPLAALGVDTLAIPHATGFHGPERGTSGPFRWTGPVATVLLRPPAQEFAVDIDARTLVSASLPTRVAFSWLGDPVPAECVSVSEGRWSLDLRDSTDPAALGRLTIACVPIVPRRTGVGDDRWLGLPISSIATRAR